MSPYFEAAPSEELTAQVYLTLTSTSFRCVAFDALKPADVEARPWVEGPRTVSEAQQCVRRLGLPGTGRNSATAALATEAFFLFSAIALSTRTIDDRGKAGSDAEPRSGAPARKGLFSEKCCK